MTGIRPLKACDFLLVNNTNFNPVLHHFQVIAMYWSNYPFWLRYLYLTPLFSMNSRTLDCKIELQKTRNITVVWHTKYFDSLHCLGVNH